MNETIRHIVAYCLLNYIDPLPEVMAYFAEKDSYLTWREVGDLVERVKFSMESQI